MAPRANDDSDDDLYDDEEEDELAEGSTDDVVLSDSLPPYNLVQRTVAELYELIHMGEIDLDPEYQREVVWPDQKQIMLIDSIMHNYYYPPVIFTVMTVFDDETGEPSERRVCMDGKQRLTSITRFIAGIIPYVSQATGTRYWFELPMNAKGKKNVALPQKLKDKFFAKRLYCVEYAEVGAEVEREIFRRVQLGVSLSAAEKMQGIQSPWTDWVRQLQKQYIENDEGLSKSILWTQKRGQDFQCVALILYNLNNLPSFAWPHSTKLDSFLRNADQPSRTFKAEVGQVFADYLAISSDDRYNYGFKVSARVSPVEIVMIGLLLGVMRTESSAAKAEEINNLRVDTRKKFKDIRSNTTITKHMWSLIKNVKPRKAVNGVKAENVESGASSPRKRKRGGKPDDDEYRPPMGGRLN